MYTVYSSLKRVKLQHWHLFYIIVYEETMKKKKKNANFKVKIHTHTK